MTTTIVNNNTVNNKIQDFGQKIGGARKDWFTNMKEAAQKFAEVSAVDLIAAPLAKVVALPNLEKMTEAGVLSTESARAVLTLWRKIGTRPAGSAYLLKRWAEEIAPRLARIGAILNGEQITEEERAAFAYKRNGRLRKGARVYRLCIESTQHTAAEYLQSISKSDEMAGHHVGAYGLNALTGYTAQDSATFADILSKAQKEQKRAQERAQARANVAEPAHTKEEEGKAAERSESNKKGNRQEVDTTEAPADGLQLVEISGGVAVVGDSRTTYRNRKEIKAHGAKWNKNAQRWEGTEPEAVAALRAWFGLSDEQTTNNTGETSEGKQKPENVTRSQLMQVVAVARWFGSVEWSTAGTLCDCDTIETDGNEPEAVTLWHRFGRPLNRRACVEMFGEDVTADGEILHTMADHSAHYTEDGNTFAEWWQAVAEISNQERAPRTESGDLSEVAKSEAVASGAPHYSVCEKSPNYKIQK